MPDHLNIKEFLQNFDQLQDFYNLVVEAVENQKAATKNQKDNATLTFVEFNAGVEASSTEPAQPCDKKFIDALEADFYRLVLMFFDTLPSIRNINNPMSDGDTGIFKGLCEVVQQYNRLKAAPELLPLDLSLQHYIAKMRQMDENLESFLEIVTEYTQYKKMKASGLKLPEPCPKFWHDAPDGKHPWTRWLENSANSGETWMAIQQKIPRFGDVILRQETLMYDALEELFEEEGFVAHKMNGERSIIGEPGDDFKDMKFTFFTTVPLHDLGFTSGERKHIDAKGTWTLEGISKVCSAFDEEESHYEPRPSRNCPYFRIGMGATK